MIINTYITRRVNGMGLGDFIRGSMALYQCCAENNIPFAMDFSQHPMGAYLKGHEISSYDESQKVIDCIDLYENQLRSTKNLWEKLKPHYKKGKVLRVYSNAWQTFPISEDCKQFIRDNMIPNYELNETISNVLHPSFNRDAYETIHIRTGDPVAYGGALKRNIIERLYDEISKTIIQIKKTSNKHIIILSDSTSIKNLIAKKFSLFTTSCVSTHLTVGGGDVAGTLADYFIILNSNKIHQFTNAYHWWGSGFSNSASWINDVPLQSYKVKCFKMEFLQIRQRELGMFGERETPS